MSSTDPKKLKAFLGNIKETLDSLSTNTSSDTTIAFSKCYRLLLLSELAQRGVIVEDLPRYVNDNSNSDKLLTIVQTHAGKSILSDKTHSQVPKPLIAGAAIMSTMAAEKCAFILWNATYHDHINIIKYMNPLISNFSIALPRCIEVSDSRFNILLSIVSSYSSIIMEYDDMKNTTSSTEKHNIVARQFAILFLRIAMGNNLRAASYSNPDQPPVWKRALDVTIQCSSLLRRLKRLKDMKESTDSSMNDNDNLYRDYPNNYNIENDYEAYHTLDAAYPLEHLIRIAESKGNLKRVSELTLRLIESYSTYDPSNLNSNLLIDACAKMWNDISSNFDHPHDAIQKLKNMSVLEYKKKSYQLMILANSDQHMSERSGDSKLENLHRLLSISVPLALENSIIQALSENRYSLARNRTGLSSTNQSASKGFYFLQVQRELLTCTLPESDSIFSADEYNLNDVNITADSLRDYVVSHWQLSENEIDSSPALFYEMYDALAAQIKRLLIRSQALSLIVKSSRNKKSNFTFQDVNAAFLKVLSFVTPIVNISCLENYDSSQVITPHLKKWNLIKQSCKAIMTVAWMLEDKMLIPFDTIDRVTSLLEYNISFYKSLSKEKNANSNTLHLVESEDNHEKLKEIDDENAYMAGYCYRLLSKIGDGVSSDQEVLDGIHQATKKLISMSNTDYSSSKTTAEAANFEYGTVFLLYILSWSGLHYVPWQFCNISETRLIIRHVKDYLNNAKSLWGKSLSVLEQLFLSLIEADSESGTLTGGFSSRAFDLYSKIQEECVGNEGYAFNLITAHCLVGILKISLIDNNSDQGEDDITTNALRVKSSLNTLESLYLLIKNESTTELYSWRGNDALMKSFQYQICQCRQVIADSLLRSNKLQEAHDLLKQAATDSPFDYDAAFSLGAFYLRMALFGDDTIKIEQVDTMRQAQNQLLKAAKINQNKADPFSLLGVFMEVQNDLKRAIGCYTKALLLSPDHPVAGRGLLRLKPFKQAYQVCDAASKTISRVNGWSWKAIGESKAFIEGNDEIAVVCFQQALRCRDIDCPQNEQLNIFFDLPTKPGNKMKNDLSTTWSHLGGCYRRLGKHSACLRAYTFAFENEVNDFNSYCAYAQIQMELGFLDDAVEIFKKVLSESSAESARFFAASFGYGTCLLSLARRDAEEGKFGKALSRLIEATESLSKSLEMKCLNISYICAWKLLGDLFSFGAVIPPFAFLPSLDDDDICGHVNSKVSFVSKGEAAYIRSQVLTEDLTSVDNDDSFIASVKTSACCDIGNNLFLQAQILSENYHDGMVDIPRRSKEIRDLLMKSNKWFLKALEIDENDPLSWCGLGCSLSPLDPVLAQHCLCRSLQIDKSNEFAWTTLALLYGEYDRLNESNEALDALTQVADTPSMWIGRALVLEKLRCDSKLTRRKILDRAADAYKAALQVSRIPAAFLGLAITNYTTVCSTSNANMTMYMDFTGGMKIAENLLSSVLALDQSKRLIASEDHSLVDEISMQGIQNIIKVDHTLKERLFQKKETYINGSDEKVDINIDNNIAMKRNIKSGFDNARTFSLQCTKSLYKETDQSSNHKERNLNGDIYPAKSSLRQHPYNGEYWLTLGKILVSDLMQSSRPSVQDMEVARAAIDRAKYIFENVVGDSRFASSLSSTVDAEILSETYALSSWLFDIDIISNNKTEDVAHTSQTDLQRALILDPENDFARALIYEGTSI